jgi:hypothetical protein
VRAVAVERVGRSAGCCLVCHAAWEDGDSPRRMHDCGSEARKKCRTEAWRLGDLGIV